jgi:CubicO group peptidase (beta-lactamase class C family)
MTTNQIEAGKSLAEVGCNPLTLSMMGLKGSGFGLGVSVALEPRGGIGSAGEYGWGGAASTVFWADPKENILCLFFTQVMHARFNLKKHLKRLVYSAVIGSDCQQAGSAADAQTQERHQKARL